MAISRETARRRTAWARVGTGVLVFCAGAVAALPVASPTAGQPSEAPAQPGKPAEGTEITKPGPGSIDVLGIASTLDAVGVARTAPPPAAPPPGAEVKTAEAEGPAKGPTNNGDWKYVGSIVGPKATHAMVSVGGRQKLLAPGQEIDGVRLMSVDPEQLVIDDHGAMKTVKLAPRDKVVPDAATGRSGARPGGPPLPPAPPAEELQRIQEQRAAEEQQRRMKDQETAQPPPAGQPVRPSPLPTDAAPAGPKRAAPSKNVGAGGRS